MAVPIHTQRDSDRHHLRAQIPQGELEVVASALPKLTDHHRRVAAVRPNTPSRCVQWPSTWVRGDHRGCVCQITSTTEYTKAGIEGGARGTTAFVKERLNWFKTDLFKWTPCEHCSASGKDCVSCVGMVEPTPAESACQAGRVELYECTTCGGKTRFPRYNLATKLLETRNGRCGEWANCFTLICRALGLPARLANDWTDHVCTEVWLADVDIEEAAGGELGGRWYHC